jgi:hypothetical protein
MQAVRAKHASGRVATAALMQTCEMYELQVIPGSPGGNRSGGMKGLSIERLRFNAYDIAHGE